VSRLVSLLREHAATVATLACLSFSVISTFHYVGSSNLFPQDGAAVVPIGHVDFALQFYYANIGSSLLAKAGTPYGYDPYFLSGYVKSPLYYPSSMPFEFLVFLFRALPPALVFNWAVLVLLALPPFLVYLSAANFGLGRWEKFAVVALLLAPEAMQPHLSLFAIMRAAGMAAFIVGSALSVYVISLFYRTTATGDRASFLLLLLLAPLLFTIHPTIPIMAIAPLAALYLWKLRTLSITRHVQLLGVAAAVVAVNWFWIHGQIAFGHYADLHAFDDREAISHFSVSGGSLLGPLRTYLLSPTLLGRIPLVFGAVGLIAWWRSGCAGRFWMFALQIVALSAVTYYGEFMGLNSASPGRFTFPLALYVFIPAGVGIVAIARLAATECRAWLSPRRQFALAAILSIGVPSCLPNDVVDKLSLEDANIPGFETASGYLTHLPAMSLWLAANTDSGGRILHEETSRFSHQYFGSYLAAILALNVQREFANGPAPYPLVKQHVLRFMAGMMADRPIDELDPADVHEMLQRYNVRWVVCWTDEAKAFFHQRYPEADHVSTYEKFDLYRIDDNPGFFAKGSGTVTSAPNELTVINAVPEGDEIVLRYHWDEHFRAEPAGEVVPVEMAGDPVPFIGVKSAPPAFRLVFDY
jgi:hypothetical protein